MPLCWDEVEAGLDPKRFHLKNALDRITSWACDPCANILTERPDLADALNRLDAYAKER